MAMFMNGKKRKMLKQKKMADVEQSDEARKAVPQRAAQTSAGVGVREKKLPARVPVVNMFTVCRDLFAVGGGA